MKIGILTYHCTTNYGATLQAYALLTAIKLQGWKDVEIINYQPLAMLRVFFIRPVQPINKKLQINTQLFVNLRKCLNMRRFVLDNLRLSQKKYYTKASLKKHCQHYDVVICGSDQIWRIDPIEGFGSEFFLDFVYKKTARQKISYAASFGDTDTLKNHQESIINLLKSFDTILVRDANSVKIVQKECKLPAVKVVDPTFLINYDAITVLPKLKEKYLLLYNQKYFTNLEEDFIKSIAKNKNLVIVSVGQVNKIANVNIVEADPKKWLGYFKFSTYIVTNTYHGTIFSIIFKKQFTVVLNENKSNKIGDLLKDYNLEDRICATQLKTPNFEHIVDIDYNKVEEKLQLAVAHSKNYLFAALKNRENLGNISEGS
ncbi:polysaccharide pyruvyl transferase family protein [Synechocystis sp. PCC 7509]|uniref:polysaccharide pyruvyl transferase family protein n=1 Tax=Synechocystis sp. PCC 7509 TaxID=927677 RepID=UPI0002ABB11E|nr:polysaccharide pyruvyl transferase family protein [Synechocystis sp. PCC 7509]